MEGEEREVKEREKEGRRNRKRVERERERERREEREGEKRRSEVRLRESVEEVGFGRSSSSESWRGEGGQYSIAEYTNNNCILV